MQRAAIIAAIVLSALLGGCNGAPDKPAFRLTDITGAEFGRNFQLTDQYGKARTLEDFKGKVVVMFFGFIYCPDVCPTTMGELALVMKELGKDAERVQVLFVTVDPERDTPELLAQYMAAFHPSFLGLHGSAEATLRTAKDFKIFYQKQPLPGGGYTVDHSAGTYVYDASGRIRLFSAYGQGAQKMLHDIRALLGQSS